MRRIVIAAFVAAALAGQWTSFAGAAPAIHTWVSGSGDDLLSGGGQNDCSQIRTPCRTLTRALEQTVATGTLNVLPGSYDAVFVTKAVEIIADQGQAFIFPSGLNAPDGKSYGITVIAGAGDTVRIRGLSVNHAYLGNSGGIYFSQGAALHVENCTLVRNSAPALNIVTSTTANITVRNCTMSLNTGGNVSIRPTNGALVVATFENVLLANSPYGIRADNSGGSGKIIVDVRNSVAKGNANNGYVAVGAGANPVHFMIDRSTAESNGVYGAVATGAQAFMIVTNSTLMSNGTGLAQLSGATVASTGTNTIRFNTQNKSGTITPIGVD